MAEELLTPEELEQNKSNRKKLFALIDSKNAILMAGSGCTATLYPPWKAFLDILENKALAIDPAFSGSKEDYLGFASKVKQCIGPNRYEALLHEEFKPRDKTHEPFHVTLCSLPFKGFVTTNYDSVLESALNTIYHNPENWLCLDNGSKRTIFEFIRSLDEPSPGSKRVLHLHGRYNISKSIVLCEEEYQEKYGFSIKEKERSIYEEIRAGNLSEEHFNELLLMFGYEWPIHRKMVWSLLATRRVVFMGFSMNDPYFIRMFQFVSDDVSPYDSDTHFLVLRFTKNNKDQTMKFASDLKERYGIETVLYQDDENYKGFENFISEMGNEIIPTPKADHGTDATVKSIQTKNGSEEITKELLALSKKQLENED